jgi:hypothetical protein
MKPHKPFIGIDLGGTIEDTWPEKSAWFASKGIDLGRYPRSRIDIVDGSTVTEALYLEMVASVYSDDHILGHRRVAGCYEALMAVSVHFDLIVLSSRPESQRAVTVQWLRQNGLLRVIDDLVLIGSDVSKLRWCQSHHVSTLIDDDIRHLQAEDDGTSPTRIHYTGCKSQVSHSGQSILKVAHWAEVPELLASLEQRRAHNLGPRASTHAQAI